MNEPEKAPAARADQIQPIDDWLFVLEDDAPSETASGLAIVIDKTKSVFEPAFGRVLAAGPGRTLPSGARVPMDVAPGARVAFLRKVHRDKVYPFQILGDPKNYWFVRRRSDELLAVEEA